MSKLVLAEKPSVAQSIAKVLGANKRCDGYLEGNGYIVSWCVGHLVELAAPEVYDEKYGKWRLEDLPILPDEWIYQVSSSTRKQYGILKDLMKRADVDSLICATDAGREGELIFRLVYNQAKCRKPFERLWISSMEDEAIREGFRNLRPGTEYDALYEAALCRERADWIVGMNATRLFSCLYGSTLNVGRVMTPTLGMAVMREAEIMGFKPEPFFTAQLKTRDFVVTSERFKEQSAAKSAMDSCLQSRSFEVVSVERKEKSEKAPSLYDLTSLQRDANRILGFTAQQTLDYTQSLYEKKLVTYPRTDSRFLTNDMEPMLPELITKVAAKFGASGCLQNEDNHTQIHTKIVCDSQKVTDHHAIIPTRTCLSADFLELPSGEMKVLNLIAARLLAAVSDPHRYAETVAKLFCAGQEFSVKGKEIIADGWKAVDAFFHPKEKKNDDKEPKVLPPLEKGMTLPILSGEIKEGKTQAPKRFTEDVILSRMETAGADEVPDEVERKGLGTPATRAGIIEKLVQKGFLERKGDKKTKYLVPTHRGNSLITVMPEMIQSPTMTADWEQKLLLIERGEYDPKAFMTEIAEMIEGLIRNYEVVKGSNVLMSENKVIGRCPHCGAEVIERNKGCFCSSRECRFALWKDNAYFSRLGKHMTGQLAEKLVRDGRAKLKDCKSQKTGKTYNATVLMTTEADGRPQFSLEFDKGGK